MIDNYRRRFVMSLVAALIGCFGLCHSGYADSPISRIDRWFVFGTNLAWFNNNYGCDIGVNHAEGGWKPTFTAENCERVFANLAKMGCPVVRIWGFERQEGLIFTRDLTSDPKYPYHEVTGLDPVFMANCRIIMEIAARHRVMVYWSLLNHLIREEQGGRHMRIITDSKVRSSYIEKAAVPFLKEFASHPAFFAVDIMNEADGAVGGLDALTGGIDPRLGCSWKEMRVFIRECAKAFHAAVPGIKVTCTSGWHEEKNLKAGRFSGLGLDFYDWHSYRDAPDLPHARTLGLDKPVMIGECGPKTQKPDAGYALQGKNWRAYLAQARKGYAGLLTWSYGNPGGATNFVMVEADHSWRSGAKMMYNATRGVAIPDAGPMLLTEAEQLTIAAINAAVKPVLALNNSVLLSAGVSKSHLEQLVRETAMYYPYLNPRYAVIALKGAAELLVAITDKELRQPGGSSERAAELQRVAREVLEPIQSIKPLMSLSAVKALNALTVKTLEQLSGSRSPYDTDLMILSPNGSK